MEPLRLPEAGNHLGVLKTIKLNNIFGRSEVSEHVFLRVFDKFLGVGLVLLNQGIYLLLVLVDLLNLAIQVLRHLLGQTIRNSLIPFQQTRNLLLRLLLVLLMLLQDVLI